jgi:hypothetical protein
MKTAKLFSALAMVSILATAAQAQDPNAPLRNGVDRASAAHKPYEEGALPPENAPQAVTSPATPAPAPLDMEPSLRALPGTASPLMTLALTAFVALAAAGGFYRFSRQQ